MVFHSFLYFMNSIDMINVNKYINRMEYQKNNKTSKH